MHRWELLDEFLNQNTYMAFIILNEDGIVIYTNRTYLNILKLPREKVIGQHILDITPNSRAYITLKTGKARVGYNWVVNDHHMIGTALPIFRDDKIIGVLGYTVFLDIWDGKNLIDDLLSKVNMYKKEALSIHKARYIFGDIIGEDEKLMKVKTLAQRVAQHSDTTVLITGESGTGKEIFAQAVHNASARCRGPFVRVNCAAIPERLLETELFGYEEGAYTGAKKGGKLGKFELANRGTLFMDEIGEMPFNMQSKLLVALQEQVIERVGGVDPIKINLRVIAATNQNLIHMVKSGLFREDLFYRLNVVHLKIPALRERKGDLMLLSRHLLVKLNCRLNTSVTDIDEDALNLISNYGWPGNVRELENAIERAIISADMYNAHVLRKQDFSFLNENPIYPPSKSKSKSLKAILQDYEKKILVQELEENNFDKTQMAKKLDIDISSLYRKLRQYQLSK